MFLQRLSACIVLLSLCAARSFAAEDAVSTQPANAPPIVSVNQAGGKGGNPALLLHQMLREAFLLEAREEFHAETVDGALRESAPESPSVDATSWEVLTNYRPSRPLLEVTVNRIQGSDKKQALKKKLNVEKVNNQASLEVEAAQAERAAREEFADVLRSAGLEPHPNSWKPSAEVPKEIEQLLNNLTIVSQFSAAQQLHAMIRDDAESPERLGALVRAYSNLGMLTEFYWTISTKAITARSLLYAERLIAKQPDSPSAYWHRGYARALAGRHHTAIEDFDAARELTEKTPADPPEWAKLATAFCEFDAPKLNHEKNETYLPLARLLYFLAIDTTRVATFLDAAVKPVLESLPDSYHVVEATAAQGHLGLRAESARTGHAMVAGHLYSQLADLEDLPPAVREVCQEGQQPDLPPAEEFKIRRKLIQALRAASNDPKYRAEPSWDALATLIEDLGLIHAARTVELMKRGYGGSAEEELAETKPLVVDHPYGKLLQLYSDNQELAADAFKSTEDLDTSGLTLSGTALLTGIYHFDHPRYAKLNTALFQRADETFYDQAIVYRESEEIYWTAVLEHQLKFIAPHMPISVGGFLAREPEEAGPLIADWEKRYADVPDVLIRLGRYYRSIGQLDDAMRLWRQTVQRYPDKEPYRLLAEEYLKKGDEDQWLATWKEYLQKVPSFGLDHASAYNKIAWHYMEKRMWAEGLPYAEQASESGAGWAMSTLGQCYEALQNWDAAENEFAADTKRYDSHFSWYFFCRRTGQGDVDAARQIAADFVEHHQSMGVTYAPTHIANYYQIDSNFDEAYKRLKPYVEHTAEPSILLETAVLADRLKDPSTRDALLRKTMLAGPLYEMEESKRPAIELISLAELLSDDLASGGAGKIDLDEAAKRVRSAKGWSTAAFYFLLGEYLDVHGKPDAAVACWKNAMLASDIDSEYRTLSGARLLDRKILPDSYQAMLQTPLTAEELKPAPPPKLRHPPDASAFAGHFYKYVPAGRLSWSDCKLLAEYMGGYLACITSEEEQTFLAKLCEKKGAWLGGFREKGKWKWVSGEPFAYTNWAKPDIISAHLKFIKTGQWAGGENFPNQAGGFVCEWDR